MKRLYEDATSGTPMIRYNTVDTGPGDVPAMAVFLAGWLASEMCQLANDGTSNMEDFVASFDANPWGAPHDRARQMRTQNLK